MSKRDIFEELMEGVGAMREHREGKRTLRTHQVAQQEPPTVSARFIRETRESLGMSAPLFAQSLRLKARTLERWEQGQAPGSAASVLISLVHEYPDTLQRIASLDPAATSRRPQKRVRRAAGTRKGRAARAK